MKVNYTYRSSKEFKQHENQCKQCKKHPMIVCPVGALILVKLGSKGE